MNAVKRMRPLLGTFVEIGLVPTINHDDSLTGRVFSQAFAAVQQLHELLSFHDPHSDLSRLNRAKGKAVELHPISIKVLRLAQAMMKASGGHFNILLGGECVRRGVLPDHGFPDMVTVGKVDDLHIRGTTACLQRPVLVTLDGIAKGFAVDYAIKQCQTEGISGGWINAGGDIRVFGEVRIPVELSDAQGNRYAIAFGDNENSLYTNDTVQGLYNMAIATSGGKDSKRYPGLLLGGSGASLPTQQYTVVSHTAWRADALTKVAASLSASLTKEHCRDAIARLGGGLVFLP